MIKSIIATYDKPISVRVDVIIPKDALLSASVVNQAKMNLFRNIQKEIERRMVEIKESDIAFSIAEEEL